MLACLAGCASAEFKTYPVPVVYPTAYVAKFKEDSRPVRSVTILKVSQGDFDEDKKPDGLVVSFLPLGPKKKPVKKLGNVRIVAYEKRMDTLDFRGKKLAEWRIDKTELAGTFQSMGFHWSYVVRLVWPRGRPEVRWAIVDVVFEDSSGALFEFTERTVAIKG